jgi:hypothetical protein
MISLRHFRQVIDKFLKSPTAGNARVQIILPNGEFYDVNGIQLMENKLIGVRESHRLVITAKALDPLAIKLYEGRDILKLVSREPCTPVAESWTKVQEHLVNVT